MKNQKKYRYEKVNALTFVSILSAISVVFVLLSSFIGDVGLFLVLILPLCASLVSVNVNFKYSLIYILATCLISCIDFQMALFVVIPSLISGFVFGKLIRVYLQGYYIILIDALILMIMQIISTYLVNFIYNIDLVNTMASLIKISESTFSKTYFLFLFMLSLIQASLSYLIITSELRKFDYEFNEKKNKFLLSLFLETSLIILTFTSMFFNHKIGYLLIGISFYMGVVLGYYNFSFYRIKDILSIQLPLYFISIIVMVILLSYTKIINQPYLFLIQLISQLITSSYIVFYQKIVKKSRITSSIFDKLN